MESIWNVANKCCSKRLNSSRKRGAGPPPAGPPTTLFVGWGVSYKIVECSNDLLTKTALKMWSFSFGKFPLHFEFFLPQVKHANAAVSSNTSKNIGGTMHKGDIVNILVVSNQLRFCLVRFDIPNCASSVNAGGDDQGWIGYVPIERS
jgi:hypothetical protein